MVLNPALSITGVTVGAFVTVGCQHEDTYKDLPLRPGWSPIRGLVAPAVTGTQSKSVTKARHRAMPRCMIIIVVLIIDQWQRLTIQRNR